jgi:TonB family protein
MMTLAVQSEIRKVLSGWCKARRQVWSWPLSAVVLALLLAGCAAQPDQPLRFVAGADAAYPAAARADGVEGYVIVEYDVDVDGSVRSPRVLQSEPEGVFDQAALDTVSGWRFEAPVIDGERQAVRGLRSRVAFQIGEPETYVAP